MDRIVAAKWWIAFPTALVLLALLDVGLALWRPQPARLPEQFSPAYLGLVLRDAPRDVPTVVVVGDSVLWGYRLDQERTAVALLRRRFPAISFLNLAYEGGSTPNSAIALRAVLLSDIHVVGVIANINSKEFSAADSAYRTLQPSLERLTYDDLTDEDRRTLASHVNTDLNGRLNDAVERIWRLYRMRTDIRQQLFGHDDLAGAALAIVQGWTGAAATEAAAHRPTPDRFLGTYDLSPIDAGNVGMRYYRALIGEACQRNIPAVFFLTPTNHRLLHDYIDSPDYDANLKRLADVPHCDGVRIVNFDRSIDDADFIDNDHVDARGQQWLAGALAPFVASFKT